MPSRALTHWQTKRRAALDEVEAAYQAVSRAAPGRQLATHQIKQAYAVLLSSQFQGFCRDLHAEAVDHVVAHLTPRPLRGVVRTQLSIGLKLRHGNPNPGNLGADFGRLGLDLWPDLRAANRLSEGRREKLQALCTWRNAIAHQDLDPTKLGGREHVRLGEIRRWRSACDALAATFDTVVRAKLIALVGVSPW